MSGITAKHISAIVPIYNVETYLGECLRTLFEQSIASDIEYIFIDDAGTDGSMAILRNEIAKHPQLDITVLTHDVNKGSAAARVTGITHAKGEYIMCIDSDDFIHPQMAEILLTEALKHDADIVMSPLAMHFPDHEEINYFHSLSIDLNQIPISVLHFTLCGKLIRRSLFNRYSLFPVAGRNCWEDLATTARAMAVTNRISIVDMPLYYYRQNPSSLSHTNHKRRLDDHLFYADFLTKWFESQGEDFYNKHLTLIERIKFCAKIKMLRGDVIEITRWKTTYPTSCRRIFTLAKQFGLAYRIAFMALNLCPTRLAIAIAKLIGKNAQ